MSTAAELRAISRLAIRVAREQPDPVLKRLLARHALGLAIRAEKIESEEAMRKEPPTQVVTSVHSVQLRTAELASAATTQYLERIINDFASLNPGDNNEAVG